MNAVSRRCLVRLAVFGSVLSALPSHSATVAWQGDVGVGWADTGNWSTGYTPGSTAADTAEFGSPSGVFQPTVDANQPMGSGRITKLTFLQSGWTLSGSSTLTLDAGNVTLGEYVASSGSGTNAVGAPLRFGSGSAGAAGLGVGAGNTLVLAGGVTFTPSVRNVQRTGSGTLVLRGAVVAADLISATGGVVVLDNAVGKAYTPTAGNKVRANGGTVLWNRDDQVLSSAVQLRVDGGGVINLDGHSDLVNYVEFAVDSASAGTVATGPGGLLSVTSNVPVKVGTSTRAPSTTAIVEGNVAFVRGLYQTVDLQVRRGAQPVDLRVTAAISGPGLSHVRIDEIAGGSPGVTEFTGANTYGGRTTVRKGTLLVNTVGASGTSGGDVLVDAGAILGGAGLIDPDVGKSVTVNGTLAPGALPGSTGALSIGSVGSPNNLVLGTGATFAVEIEGGAADAVDVVGSAVLGGSLDVSHLTPHALWAYRVMTATGGISGTFASQTGETQWTVEVRNAGTELWLVASPPETVIILR